MGVARSGSARKGFEMIGKYEVIATQDHIALQREVSELIVLGWQPIGGVAAVNANGLVWYLQAMIYPKTVAKAKREPSPKQPTSPEWVEYCLSIGWESREQIMTAYDHYEANGWKQASGRPIKQWKAAARTCYSRNKTDGDTLDGLL
jgi:hypothetical protein